MHHGAYYLLVLAFSFLSLESRGSNSQAVPSEKKVVREGASEQTKTNAAHQKDKPAVGNLKEQKEIPKDWEPAPAPEFFEEK